MNVYFACSSSSLYERLDVYEKIVECIGSLGHSVVENWIRRVGLKKQKLIEEAEGNSRERLRREGIESVKNADLLVAEISLQSVGVGYQIATALQNKIPVLCLVSEELKSSKPSQIITSNNSPLITIKKYNKDNIHNILSEYFDQFNDKTLIKFNFIITTEIDAYLNWKSHNGKLSKSEILRQQVVDKIIRPDKEYNEWVRNMMGEIAPI